ncbi:MAG: hypothetical protein AB7S44_00555 [Spirochaetales bacterium]
MSVTEIIKLVATYLQMEDVLELTTFGGEVTEPSALTTKNLELLVRCLNLVYDEIATDYIPLNYEEEVIVLDEEIALSSLAKRLINVIKLTDENGVNVKYKMFPTAIVLENGTYNLEYSYAPESATLDGNIETFGGKLTERIVAYGVTAEYSLISGLFDEATTWEQRFKDALLVASRKKSDIKMPVRRWL